MLPALTNGYEWNSQVIELFVDEDGEALLIEDSAIVRGKERRGRSTR